jgi:VWFA-related protein
MAASGPQGVPQQQQAPPAPTFRSGVTAVPIDVRVTDREGKPVTDLTQGDFTVFEDDVRQTIVHFSEQVLVARPPGPALRARADVPAFDASPQNQRVFLILLGAGALGSRPLGPGTRIVPDPSNALDGLLHLLRHQLFPQDQVALLAYNRATDFSADHEGLARTLEAFRESEEGFVALLAHHSAATPVSSAADSVFAAARGAILPAAETELGFAEYVNARNRTTGDFENLYYGIKYLRFIAGEKHLIFVTAEGIPRPMPGTWESVRAKPWEDFAQLAIAASNARVALDVIQTGGIPAAPGRFLAPMPIMWPFILVPGQAYFGMGGTNATTGSTSGGQAPPQPGWDRPPPDPPVPIPGLDAAGVQALSDLRTLASLTGGQASIMGDAAKAVDRIDAETRVVYLLAYYPAKPFPDGRSRSIRVEVNRPGVTVRFRHGYSAELDSGSLSRRTVVADGRLIAAAASTRPLRDVRITASPTFTKNRTGKGGELMVKMVIDAARFVWTTDDLSRRVAHLDVAIYCGDAREKVVGQTRRMLNVALTEERFGQIDKQGLPYSVRIPVEGSPRFVKIVVYNYEADLAGSTVVTIK